MAKYIICLKENLISQTLQLLKIRDYLVSTLLVAVFVETFHCSFFFSFFAS